MAQISTIASIAEFSELVEREFRDDRDSTVLYRGHGAASFVLRPKVGRLQPPDNSTSSAASSVKEGLMLELFRRQAIDRIDIAAADDWELLAIAQHHGMATRLLDWTRSPLVALYFAVYKECESRKPSGEPLKEDAEVIAWRTTKENLAKPLPTEGPLGIKQLVRYIPRIVTPRLRAQSGLFTVHPNPIAPFTAPGGELKRIRIPYVHRKALKDSLFRHGIHEAVLFPDLDALARHIEWCQTKCY